MLNPQHLLDLVVDPVLHELDIWSETARQLVMGTAAQESGLRHLTQLGGGPARGIFQMEPATYEDIWENWLAHNSQVAEVVESLRLSFEPDEMAWNLQLAAAMCRVHYRRFPGFPEEGNVRSLGEYWKKFYNTPKGAGTVEEFERNFALVASSLGL